MKSLRPEFYRYSDIRSAALSSLLCQYEDEKISNVERKWKEVLLFFPAVFVKVNLALYGVQRERMI